MSTDRQTDVTHLLAFEEGYREKAYYDSKGYPTIGIGQLLGPKDAPLSNYTFTLPRTVAEWWVLANLEEIAKDLDSTASTAGAWSRLKADRNHGCTPYTDPRCAVYLSMAYQMGVGALGKFTTTNRLISTGDYAEASEQALKSLWASQTPERAKRHAEQLKTGLWAKEY